MMHNESYERMHSRVALIPVCLISLKIFLRHQLTFSRISTKTTNLVQAPEGIYMKLMWQVWTFACSALALSEVPQAGFIKDTQ